MNGHRTPRIVHIGAGAGFADERPDAVVPVVATLEKRIGAGPSYVIFETLAERTLALAQLERRANPQAGYTPQLLNFLRPILRRCLDHRIKIIANSGAANPRAAAQRIIELAEELGLPSLRVAVVEGDDLLSASSEMTSHEWPILDGPPLGGQRLIAANAYIGAMPIRDALLQDVNVVITGRCVDSALVLGPLAYEFGWKSSDFDLLAAGSAGGHLLECSAQVSGGYFADPGYKDVPDLAAVGLPIGEFDGDGGIVIGKADGTGGLVSARTVKEQLLYELHDPACYLLPDVTMDITLACVQEIGPDRVAVSGIKGRPPPETLKVTLSVEGGWLAEAEISYAGPNALPRAELAATVLRKRMDLLKLGHFRIDIIGTCSVFDSQRGQLRMRQKFPSSGDYRVRLAAGTATLELAQRAANEVMGLYSTGPAGGGGVRKNVVSRVETRSSLIPRAQVHPRVSVLEYRP